MVSYKDVEKFLYISEFLELRALCGIINKAKNQRSKQKPTATKQKPQLRPDRAIKSHRTRVSLQRAHKTVMEGQSTIQKIKN